MTTEDVTLRLKADGEERLSASIADVTRRLESLERELKSVSGAQNAAAGTQRALSSGAQAVTQNLGKFASSAGIVSQSIGRFSQAGGQATQVLGQTLSAVTGLSAGMGPLGVATGLAVGAVGLLSVGLKTLADDLGKSREEQNRFVRAFVDGFSENGTFSSAMDDFLEGARDAFGISGSGWAAFMEDAEDVTRAFGIALRVTIDNAVTDLKTFVLTLEAVAQAIANGDYASAQAALGGGVGAVLATHGTTGARVAAGIAAGEREDTLRDFLGNRSGNKPPPTAGGRGRGGGRRDDYMDRLRAAEGRTSESAGTGIDYDALAAEQAAAVEQMRIDALESEFEALMKVKDLEVQREEERQRQHDNEMQRAEAMKNASMSLVASVGQTIAGAMKEGKAKHAFVASLATIRAAFETAEGIANVVKNPVEAATHFAAAAQFGVTAGMEFGAATKSSGGGARGGAGPIAAPTRDVSPVSESRQSRSVTVIFNGTSIIGQTIEDAGLLAKRAIQLADSRYGV